MHVLLVDDHPDTLAVMRRVRLSRGMKVTTAGLMQQALEEAAEKQFDLIISDIGLP